MIANNDTFGDDFEKELADKPTPPVKEKIDGGKVELAPQRIIALHAENVKRLTVVDITPGKGVVRITGENGAGKSSVLDAISMALQGTRTALTKPVREGKDKAYVLLETEDLIVRRSWSKKGETSQLELTAKDGTEVTSPQRLLDRLVSKVAIDPLAFIRQTAKEQAEALMKLFPPADANGECFNLGENRKMIELAMDARKDKAAVLKARQADYARLKDVPNDDIQPVDVKLLQGQFRKLEETKDEYRLAVWNYDETCKLISKLQEQLEEAKSRQASYKEALTAMTDPNPEMDKIRQQVAEAHEINANAAKIAEKQTVLKAGRTAKSEFEASEKRVEELRTARKNAFQSIQYPLEGLSVSEECELLYNGLPIDQCCTSEQIKIGIALGAAANPGMRLAFVRDGSLLDDASMQVMEGCAEKFDIQILVERVNDNHPAAVHIVDGSNVGATDADGKPNKGKDVFDVD